MYLERFLNKFSDEIIITSGSDGAYVFYNSALTHVSSNKVMPVDLTGAGDMFLAAYLLSKTKDKTISESIKFANKCSGKIIQKYGAVSVQCCLSMVNNLSKISKSKVCISITGIAGPKGGSKQKPVGLVYIGIKKDKIVKVNRYIFKNRGRNYIQKATVNKALKLTHNLL